MTTLISFLGKGQDGRGYRDTTYHFPDGELVNNQKYIGLALANKYQPNKIVLLGTAGSMWDVFLEQISSGLEEEWVELSDSVKEQRVTKEQLQPFEQFLSERLSAEVHCILIPFAKDTIEQMNILSVMSDSLDQNESIILDVTHGFRHLPMLALVAARFLKKTKSIETEHIYYGALDMTQNDETPVLLLDGLLDMLDWVDALTTFDKDGDYRVFEPLLIEAGLKQEDANVLADASFYERNINASDASRKLQQVMPKLDELNNNSTGLYNLFHEQLSKRLDWFKRSSLGLQEQGLAEKYLKRGDYLRTVIYAMEGLISRKVEQNYGKSKLHDYDTRQEAYQELRDNKSFNLFKDFRNSMVHGTASSKKEVKTILKDPNRLEQSIKDRVVHLFKKG